MECMAREIPRREVDQGITQRDQFNTEEFAIGETLVREPLQNSLDGHIKGSPEPVRTKITLVEAAATDAKYWGELLSPLRPHLEASRIDLSKLDLSRPRILLIEDFGTTGLLGDPDNKDSLNFSDFWRRFGLSHKKGGAGGRWGLGKLVYSSASAIGTFFGLTIRHDDPASERLLMGQAVLNNHKIGNKDYAPHIFFAVPAHDQFQLPEREPSVIDQFCKAAGIQRKTEPGLSIAILCASDGLSPLALLPHVITNYFFPVLTGRLVVEIGDKTVTADTFDELAKAHGGAALSDGSLVQFIRSIPEHDAATDRQQLSLEWPKRGVAASLSEEDKESLQNTYRSGALASIRAPLVLRRKGGHQETTYVDAYLKKTPDSTNGVALFVRGSITIPGEARAFRGRKAFGAVIAADSAITEFLGDAENPAHTKWVGSAKKLSDSWDRGAETVSAIRRLLNEFYDLVADADTTVDEDIFAEFFSIPDPTLSKKVQKKPEKPSPPSPPPKPPILPPAPRSFKVNPKSGGFSVVGVATSTVAVPYKLNVQIAYGVFRGNAFKKHKRQDFDFSSTSHPQVSATGASWKAINTNMLEIDVSSPTFRFEVTGFDLERDLELQVE